MQSTTNYLLNEKRNPLNSPFTSPLSTTTHHYNSNSFNDSGFGQNISLVSNHSLIHDDTPNKIQISANSVHDEDQKRLHVDVSHSENELIGDTSPVSSTESMHPGSSGLGSSPEQLRVTDSEVDDDDEVVVDELDYHNNLFSIDNSDNEHYMSR